MESNEKKRVLSNLISLLALQGANYFLPLLLFPYLARTLGVEQFGLLAFATAAVAVFRAVTTYGFDLTGTREISIVRNNFQDVGIVASSILCAKLFISACSVAILVITVFAFERFRSDYYIYLLCYLVVVGDILFPVWLLQGLEKMKLMTYFRLGYKTVFTIAVFSVVKREEDLFLVPLLDGVGAILTGFVALWYAHYVLNVPFAFPEIRKIKEQLISGWHVFLSNMAVLFYSSFNVFVLGFFVSNALIGNYAIAEKIYMAVRGMLGPVTQAIFPYLARAYALEREKYYSLVRKMGVVFVGALLVCGTAMFALSSELVALVSPSGAEYAVTLLKIFSVSLVFAIGGFCSTLLVIKSKGNVLFSITMKAMLINLLAIVPAAYYFGVYGVAILFLVVQAFQSALQVVANKEILPNIVR